MEAVSEETLDEYFADMKAISNLLREGQLFEGWKQLHDLADYALINARISRQLANRVESFWNMDRATVSLDRRNDQIRKDVRSANRNADLLSDRVFEQELEDQRRAGQGRQNQDGGQQQNLPNGGVPMAPPNGGGGGQSSFSGLEGKLQRSEEYLRSLELKANIKLNELKRASLEEPAKADFSAQRSAMGPDGR